MKFGVGYKIGNIEVIKVEYIKEKRTYICYCKCLLCGKVVKHSRRNMQKLKGIGCRECINKEKKNGAVKHTRLYRVWEQMKHRCRCSETDYNHWKNYGGRGIDICKEWETYAPFKKWAEENGWTEDDLYSTNRNKMTIDRIDNNGNYEPSNCRIISHREQQWNKRNTIKIEYNGEIYNLLELSKKLNISIPALKARWKGNKPLDAPYKSRKSPNRKEKNNVLYLSKN